MRELASLKTEAKSATKLKEISYELENKVVELTQALQKRVSENKDLVSRVAVLENETAVLNQRNKELLIGRQELEQAFNRFGGKWQLQVSRCSEGTSGV